jgi:hypothetical protein
MRIYESVRENLPLFRDFFGTHLLPVQLSAWRAADRPLGD